MLPAPSPQGMPLPAPLSAARAGLAPRCPAGRRDARLRWQGWGQFKWTGSAEML